MEWNNFSVTINILKRISMRKLNFFFATLFYVLCCFGQTKHITLTFNVDDFAVCNEGDGRVYVTSYSQNVFHKEDTTTACVPYILMNITIPYDKSYANVQYEWSDC